MKKKYTKPQIVFENFSLSTSIAGSCEVPTNTFAARQCNYVMGPIAVFLTSITGCDYVVGTEDGEFGDICYHVPAGYNNLFNS